MKRPIHPMLQFVSLFTIAAPLLLAFCFAIDRTFLDDPEASGLLTAERHLFKDVATSQELLDDLIERDEVTWDPTNGARIGRVLAHLKRTDGPKLLLVGSSQMLVVRDDRSRAGIAKRIDRVLDDRLGGRVTVYNLSLGGMTLGEKRWMLEQAVRLVDFDSIIVGMTLWDSVSDDVRPALMHPRDPLPERPGRSSTGIDWPAPATINRAVTGRVTRTLGETVPFFRHRTAIQRWLKGEVSRALLRDVRTPATSPGERRPTTAPPGAEPVRYIYPAQKQAMILDRLGAFLSSLQAIRSSSGAEIMVLLTPFRQDPERPAYSPPAFYERFRESVARACDLGGFVLLDASSLLGRSHFGLYADGPEAGKVDVLHFDASGHDELAGAIERSSLFHRNLRAAGQSGRGR